MHQQTRLGYAEEESFQALELPYAGRELSMVVLLPKKIDGLPDLEKGLSVDKLTALFSKLARIARSTPACPSSSWRARSR